MLSTFLLPSAKLVYVERWEILKDVDTVSKVISKQESEGGGGEEGSKCDSVVDASGDRDR